MTDLKPCPYCGFKTITIYQWPGDLFFAFCLDADCANEGPKATSRERAIAKWNRRPEEDRLLALLGKALEEEEK